MFSLDGRRTWWLSFIFWTAYAILDCIGSVAILAAVGQQIIVSRVVVWNFAEAELWVLFTPLICAVASRSRFGRHTWKRSLTVHIPLALTISTLGAGLLIGMNSLLGWNDSSTPLTARLTDLTLAILPRCLVTMGIVHGVDYYVRLGRREVESARLETRLAQAQMEILRSQLEPHFLFNTLNSIAALTKKDPESAEDMTIKLAALLRASLDCTGSQEVPLQQELQFLQSYIDIQQTRFRDRLTISMDIDPALLSAPIPSLILQPLVENSIRHGIAASAAAGRIQISVKQDRDCLTIEVSDNGVGMHRVEGSQAEGFGLRNTRARLEQLYGIKHHFKIESTPGVGCRVIMSVPLPAVMLTQRM